MIVTCGFCLLNSCRGKYSKKTKITTNGLVALCVENFTDWLAAFVFVRMINLNYSWFGVINPILKKCLNYFKNINRSFNSQHELN